MKAIETHFIPCGDVRGARIAATDHDGNRVVISYPDELTGEACHRAAADALCRKMGWTGRLISGAVKRGYVFVWAEENTLRDSIEAAYRASYSNLEVKELEALALLAQALILLK